MFIRVTRTVLMAYYKKFSVSKGLGVKSHCFICIHHSRVRDTINGTACVDFSDACLDSSVVGGSLCCRRVLLADLRGDSRLIPATIYKSAIGVRRWNFSRVIGYIGYRSEYIVLLIVRESAVLF